LQTCPLIQIFLVSKYNPEDIEQTEENEKEKNKFGSRCYSKTMSSARNRNIARLP